MWFIEMYLIVSLLGAIQSLLQNILRVSQPQYGGPDVWKYFTSSLSLSLQMSIQVYFTGSAVADFQQHKHDI